jgi:hypothetical protein
VERRGHCFARYADDCNVYVRSQKAGERVMRLLRRCYDKLHLKINESKNAVKSVFGRKSLGGTIGSGSEPALVAQWLVCYPQRVDGCLFRSARCAKTLMTSTSRTARCGPACRVVWSLRLHPPPDLKKKGQISNLPLLCPGNSGP